MIKAISDVVRSAAARCVRSFNFALDKATPTGDDSAAAGRFESARFLTRLGAAAGRFNTAAIV